MSNIFMVFAPLLGWRWTRVTAHRTYRDWAHLVRDLVDVKFPEADGIVLVVDNLNIHVRGALYETFPPAEARRILDRLEIHYAPKHGSWLNMAEIELSVVSRQSLARRLGTERLLKSQVSAWETARNHYATTVAWRFTTAEARIKLKRLYPVITDAAPDTPPPSRERPAVQPQGLKARGAKKAAKASVMKTTRRLVRNRIV